MAPSGDSETKTAPAKPAGGVTLPPGYFGQLVQMSNDLNRVARNLSFALQEPMAAAHRLAAQMRPALEAAASLQRFSHDFAKHIPGLIAAAKDQRAFLALAAETEWPPPMHLDPAEVRTILADVEKAPPSRRRERMGGRLVAMYSRDRIEEEILARWHRMDWVKERRPLLVKALESHFRGDFELSVPVLIAQTEGLVADGFRHRDRMTNPAWKGYIAKLFPANGDSLKSDEAAARFVVRCLLKGFFWGAPVPELSRHAILHGADVHYGTPTNSLRMILLVDAVVGALDDQLRPSSR